MDEIRQMTKAKIIRRNPKKNEDSKKDEVHPKDKSFDKYPKKVSFKIEDKMKESSKENFQKKRVESKNSMELAENSVKKQTDNSLKETKRINKSTKK